MHDKRLWNYNITLHSQDHQHDDWAMYYGQYKFTVEMIFETAYRGSCTGIYLPILFLIRHTLELGYKTNLKFLNPLLKPEEQIEFKNDHNLSSLHEKFRQTVKKINISLNLKEEFIKEFEKHESKLNKFKQELHEIDSGSTTFRYPSTREGDPSIPAPVNINFINIKKSFEESITVLTYTHDVIHNYLNREQ